MKRTFLIVLSVFFIAAGPAAAAERTVTLAVEGMTCASCPYIVRKTLTAVPGVLHVEVSLDDQTAKVSYDDADTTVKALTDATANSGYPSHVKTSQ